MASEKKMSASAPAERSYAERGNEQHRPKEVRNRPDEVHEALVEQVDECVWCRDLGCHEGHGEGNGRTDRRRDDRECGRSLRSGSAWWPSRTPTTAATGRRPALQFPAMRRL